VPAAADPDAELKKWITPDERKGHKIPTALQLTSAEKDTVDSMACFAVDFKGIGHIEELFYFMGKFNFLEQFKVTNERFFRFVSEIAARYAGTW
jgi:hypothetical protein